MSAIKFSYVKTHVGSAWPFFQYVAPAIAYQHVVDSVINAGVMWLVCDLEAELGPCDISQWWCQLFLMLQTLKMHFYLFVVINGRTTNITYYHQNLMICILFKSHWDRIWGADMTIYPILSDCTLPTDYITDTCCMLGMHNKSIVVGLVIA